MRPPGRRPAAVALGAAAFMLWTRMRNAGSLRRDGELLLAGNDPWYHWRATQWTAANWPRTLDYDPWTSFPAGATVGQFGTPFDLLGATVGLAAGLGDVRAGMWAVAALPAVLGALVALPVYSAAASVASRRAAAASAAAIALSSSTFLHRSAFGFYDHHVMEVLLQCVVVALLATGWRRRGRLVVPVLGGAAGLAMALYIFVWPPAVYFVGLAAGGMLAGALVDHARGGDDWPGALEAGYWFCVPPTAAVAAFGDLSAFSLTDVGAAQMAVPAAGMAGLGVMAPVLAVAGDRWGRRRAAAGAALVSAAAPAAALLHPTVRQWAGRALAGGGARTQTIAEAQSVGLLDAPGFLLSQYGLVPLLALAGLAVLLNRPRPGRVLVAVWLIGTVALALGQVRSNYYLAPALAVAAGPAASAAASRAVGAADAASPGAAKLALAVLLVGAAALPASGSLAATPGPGDAPAWTGTLDWMEEETPEPAMGYHGRYEPGDFDYAGRSYGVLSWWDYGHWITERARRPAVANPFQQNAEEAALYFTAESEAEAGRALEALNGTAGERVRYVVVDDRTVAGKFGAVAVWAGEDPASYTDGASFSERHGRTMAARLYLGDASGLSHHRLVHESRTRSILAGVETAAGAPVRGKSRTPASQARAVRRSSTYRLVDPARHSTVKVFERVPGARLEYEGPAVVSLGVETNTGREFTYRNSGNGSVTVPYASIDEPYRVNFTDGGTAVAWVNETEVRDGATVDVDR